MIKVMCPNCGKLSVNNFNYNQCPVCGDAVEILNNWYYLDKIKDIRTKLEDLLYKASLGNNPFVCFSDICNNYHDDTPYANKFIDLYRLLHGNRYCWNKEFLSWLKDADGLLYYWLTIGTPLQKYINGIEYVIGEIEKMSDFREKVSIIKNLKEMSNNMRDSLSLQLDILKAI